MEVISAGRLGKLFSSAHSGKKVGAYEKYANSTYICCCNIVNACIKFNGNPVVDFKLSELISLVDKSLKLKLREKLRGKSHIYMLGARANSKAAFSLVALQIRCLDYNVRLQRVS